jgi:acyl-coenzyme A synthetase/AMP-(fatty) acid ligase/acyl carrier protein
MPLNIPSAFNIASWFVDRPAQEHPDRVAILGGTSEVSYEALRLTVNRAGNALRGMGCVPGRRVLLALPDSAAFVTAFFGAAKIGAIPVPVSPASTTAEFSHYLSDSGATVAIAHVRALPRIVPALENVSCRLVVVAPDTAAGIEQETMEDAIRDASPELDPHPTAALDPAFFLYSSGSTGSPKAAVHRHQGMYATTRSFAEEVIAMGPDDRILSLPHLFYAYGLGTGMYFPLALRAKTILSGHTDSFEAVAELITRYRPTIIFGVPAFLQAWFRELGDSEILDLSSVRLIVYGGEPAPVALFEEYRKRFGIEMLGCYGTTEMLQTILSNRPGSARIGTCGPVVPNYEMRIVRDDGQLASDGEVGTLRVKGQSSFIEYWNQPEATARAKVGEWVITGDRFVRDADGHYHFRGRADHFIKVLGKWVSLVEMEGMLSQHPDIEQAVVLKAGGEAASQSLLAFTVTREAQAVAAVSLRQYLSDRLPGLALPVAFRQVDALPLTPTGKIDRQALLRENLAGAASTNDPAPHTAIERKLAEIWSSVLEVSEISRQDNFLDLGGNSLLAMQCLIRVQNECRVEVSLQALLNDEADLRTLAELVERMQNGGHDPDMDVS